MLKTGATGWPARFRALLAPPSDPFLALRLQIAKRVELSALVALCCLVAILPLRNDVTWVDFALYPSIGVLLGAMLLLRPRFPEFSGFLGGAGFTTLVTVAAWYREGLASGVTSGAIALAVVVSGLLWGPRRTFVVAAFGSAATALLAWKAPVPATAPLRSWAELSAILVTLALFVELSLSALASRTLQLQSSRQRFQQLFDAAPDGLILVDQDGRVQLVNSGAQRLLGKTETELAGTPLQAHPAFGGANARLLDPIASAHPQQKTGDPEESEHVDQAVSLTPGRHHKVLVTSLSGERGTDVAHWLVTIQDITESATALETQRRFEARLAKSQALEALGRLAGGVAHDFNNLLTVIWGTADLLLSNSDLNDADSEHLASISSAAQSAAELTSQLLAFGRQQLLEPVVYSPNESLERLTPILERLVPSNIKLNVKRDPELGYARIDPARLEQVLVNLVTNAADAMPDGGTLTLASDNYDLPNTERKRPCGETPSLPEGAYVCISVRDTGHGMDEATQRQIFEPFFTTKTLGKGTGLGLATAFGIVNQSGGHIHTTSKLGVGTCFQLFFPRISELQGNVRAKPDSKHPHAVNQALSVLLVEDNDAVRTSVQTMLNRAGHRVTCAENGQQALDCLARLKNGELENVELNNDSKGGDSPPHFDVLLTDMVMPHMNGRELAQALLAQDKDIRVLYMTGYSEERLSLDGVNAELHYLAKPFTRYDLEAKLREMFSR